MKIVVAFFCLASVSAMLHPQTTKPSQNSSGPCSPNIIGPGNTVIYSQPCPSSSSTPEQMAEAMERAMRVRNSFTAERDKPIDSIYVVVSLIHPITPSEINDYAGVIEILSPKEDPYLSFGFIPGIEEWTELETAQKIELPGYHSDVWSNPKNPQVMFDAEEPSMIGDLLLARFQTLDRLEAGAIKNIPFRSTDELNGSSVEIYATKNLSENLDQVSVIVNDFVVFNVSKAEIANWIPTMGLQSRITGEMIQLPGSPHSFRKFTLYVAQFHSKREDQALEGMQDWSVIDLDQFKVSIHRMGDFDSLSGSMWIHPNEHGWLPKD